MAEFSLWARVMVSGIISGVSLVAYPNLRKSALPKPFGSAGPHDTLVTSSNLLQRSVVQTLSDFRALLLDGDENVAGLVVESFVRGVVSNLLDCLPDNGLVVDQGFGGDFTEHLPTRLS